MREVAGSVVISRREERQNRGRAQIISLITSKVKNLDMSFGEKLNEMLLAPTGTGLTAGNSGKDLLPLTEIIQYDGLGTVHSIDASTQAYWENKNEVSASGAGATSYTAFKNELRNMYYQCSRGSGGRPNLVLTSQEGIEAYESALEGQVRYGSTEMANLGFESIMLRSAQVVWDEICPKTDESASAYVLHDSVDGDTENFFFINDNFLKLLVDSGSDLVNRPFMDSVNQTAKSALVLFMGQLICTNRRKQGVLTDVSPGNLS